MRISCSAITLIYAGMLAAPAASAPTSQSMVIATLTAQFIAHSAEQDSLRTRDLQRADDERRKLEEIAARKLADANARFRSALRVRIQNDNRELAAARSELIQAAESYSTKLSQNDAIWAAKIAAYRDQLTQTISQASPEKLAAFVRLANGDDSAFAYIAEITQAEISARHAVTRAQDIAQLMQLAYLQEMRYSQGKVTKEEVIVQWEEAVAVDPGDYLAPTGLCRFYSFAAIVVGPGGEPGSQLDLEQSAFANRAATRCAILAAGTREPIRRLPILANVAEIRSSREQFDEVLRVYKTGTDIINNLIATGVASKPLKEGIGQYAKIGAEAERSLLRNAKRASRTYPELTPKERRMRRNQDYQGDKLQAAKYYSAGFAEFGAMLRGNPSSPDIYSDLEPIYHRMAHAMQLLGSSDARSAFQSTIDVAERSFKASPSSSDARHQLGQAYAGASEFFAKAGDVPRSVALLDKAIELWRARLQVDPSDRDAIDGLGFLLKKKADRIPSGNASKALPIYIEVIELDRKSIAMTPKDMAAWDELADAYEGAALASNSLYAHVSAKTYVLAAVDARRTALRGVDLTFREDALADTLYMAATILTEESERGVAAELIQERIRILRKLYAKYPGNGDYPEEILDAQESLKELNSNGRRPS